MRYLSLFFASMFLVGCAQSTEVQTSTEDVDIQSQQQSSEPEVETNNETDSQPSEKPDEPTETNTETEPEPVAGSSEPTEPEPTGFTLAMVKENDDASSCWSVINGNVYDLTAWINQHPGGSSRILGLCGTDGSSSFNAIHGGQIDPEIRLQSFLLGPLS